MVIISKPPLIAYLLASTPFMEARLLPFSAEVAQLTATCTRNIAHQQKCLLPTRKVIVVVEFSFLSVFVTEVECVTEHLTEMGLQPNT